MRGERVLVSVTYPHGEAAVLADEHGGLSLTGQLASRPGTRITRYDAAVEGAYDMAVLGGALPPGAVACEVCDGAGVWRTAACGQGAWVCVLEHPASHDFDAVLVRFRDGAGGLVARPWPGDWPRHPLPEVDEPCPACGARAWSELLPLDGSYGMGWILGGPIEPTPLAVCAVCGHAERMGFVVAVPAQRDQPAAAQPASARLDAGAVDFVAAQRRMVLLGLAFPVFVVPGWRYRLDGSSFDERGRTRSVTVAHVRPDGGEARLSVESNSTGLARFLGPRERALEALRDELNAQHAEEPIHSPVGFFVSLANLQRLSRRAALSADERADVLTVDGQPRPFLVLQTGATWVAVGDHGDVALTIAAHGLTRAEVRLQRLQDPAVPLADDA